MAARKVDVKSERQRALHNDLVLIQLRQFDDQRFASFGFRFVKSYSFDNARGLHGIQSFNCVRWSERVGHLSDSLFFLHRFSIEIYFQFKKSVKNIKWQKAEKIRHNLTWKI